MATKTAQNPKVAQGPVMETVELYILNGQSWSAGQFLNVDASGLLNTCASDDDAGTGGGVKYYALTAQTDPGNSTTKATVGVITSDHVFEINVYHGTAASAVAPITVIGQQYALYVASNVCWCDISDTTNVVFTVVDVASEYEPMQNLATDIYGLVRVSILDTVLQCKPA